jgi:hypothetical protein
MAGKKLAEGQHYAGRRSEAAILNFTIDRDTVLATA